MEFSEKIEQNKSNFIIFFWGFQINSHKINMSNKSNNSMKFKLNSYGFRLKESYGILRDK